jgi:hypothetical protein
LRETVIVKRPEARRAEPRKRDRHEHPRPLADRRADEAARRDADDLERPAIHDDRLAQHRRVRFE